MNVGDLCEADRPLPNGNRNYNINNCGFFDVFRKVVRSPDVPSVNLGWVGVTSSECPSDNGRSLPDCSRNMQVGALCAAVSRLPNDNRQYNINNCGSFNVFRYINTNLGCQRNIDLGRSVSITSA